MKTKSTPPRLVHIANLWSLVGYPPGKKEWSLEQKIAAVKEAGFDGFTTLLDAKHAQLASKHGLCTIGYFASGKPSDFRSLIQQNGDAGALRINVQLADHDTPVEKAVALAVRVVEEGDKLGVPCDIEVHRDTCTETPEKTYAIAAGFKKATGRLMPMTWDFSHLSVVKHLAPPYADRLIVDKALIRNSFQFHFRPFNGHHCQIPVTDGNGRLSVEFKQWLPFLDAVLETRLSGHPPQGDIFVCPEMGPVGGGYNFEQLPNSWEEAKRLRVIIDKALIRREPVPRAV